MRSIDAAIITQLQAMELTPVHLIDMTIDGVHYRYTDCDVPIRKPNFAYNFRNSQDGWTGSNITVTQNSDSVLLTTNNPDPQWYLQPTDFSGADNPVVQVRVKRTAGTGWDGQTFYRTSGHTYSSSYRNRIYPAPDGIDDGYVVMTYNMGDLLYGGDDWLTNDITGLRFDFGLNAPDTFEVDWIQIGGPLFSPLPFSMDPIQYSSVRIVDQARIKVDNLDSVMTALFVGGTPEGSEAVIELGLIDADGCLAGGETVTLFEGTIDAWVLDEGTVKITLASLMARWSQRTLSTHSASCRWKDFKGTECGYSGSEDWCDRTYTRCEALNNQAHFGGFRWLPSLMDKEIWWGRSRSV